MPIIGSCVVHVLSENVYNILLVESGRFRHDCVIVTDMVYCMLQSNAIITWAILNVLYVFVFWFLFSFYFLFVVVLFSCFVSFRFNFVLFAGEMLGILQRQKRWDLGLI